MSSSALRPSPALRALLTERPGPDLGDGMSVWAADQVPLPLPRVLEAIAPLAKRVPGPDPASSTTPSPQEGRDSITAGRSGG